MRMNTYLFSSLFLSSWLTFVSVLAVPPDMKCEVSRCGNVTEVSYPFWLSGEQPSYCGFPAFELQCKDGIPLMETPYGEYEVKKIFYGNNSFLVADTSLIHIDCPIFSSNVTFTDTPFVISSLANRILYLLRNCSRVHSGYFNIACAENANRTQKSAYLGGDYRADAYLKASCSDVSYVPVLDYPGANSSQYKTLVNNGFLLEWTVSDCDQCTQSKGQCGYSNQTDNFICICPDSLQLKSCDGGSRKRKVVVIGAIVGGAVALIMICCIAILYKRRKRLKRSDVSNLLSQSTSSQLYSKKDAELGESSYHTHIFSYEELQVATNGFDSSRELGDGGFGTVYKGTLRDGRTVAVKRLYENNYRRLEQFMNEIAILSRLRHQNLVTLYGCTSRHSRELLLVYEFVPNGTIADHLHGTIASAGPLPWNVRMSIAIETAYALAYLHAVEPQIIHRDVKSNNILLDNNFHVKVADFGLSRLFPLDVTHVSTAPQGTPGYVDPEYHQCYQLTDKSDVYSFGVVLVELISSKPAVDISRSRHEINLANMAVSRIQNRQLDQLVDPLLGYQSDMEVTRMITQVAELAFRCLQSDRDLRPSIKEVLEELKAIYNVGYEVEKKSEAAEAPIKEETKLLKNAATPFSPDSVTEKWQSSLTTPNNSG